QVYASILIDAVYQMKNYPITLVSNVIAPFSVLILIILVSHGQLLSISIEGALITSMISSGVTLQIDLSHIKNDFKLQDMLISSPTSAFTYTLGMAMAALTNALPALAVLTLLALLFIRASFIGALTVLAVFALIFAFSVALGFMLSTFSTDIQQNRAFVSILTVILATIAPIYYPITFIPLSIRAIAYLSPATYAAEIAQNAIGALALSASNIAIDWIVLIAVSAVLFTVAVKKSHWRDP
ncbi:MAG TPA: ABC transporter permease, partial [Nitrososphaerales archaeon]|nr:ABC transporter permease [Nitrososphaerales archaeon]